MAQCPRNILIIGKSGAGKTSITNAILNMNKDLSPVDSFMQTYTTRQRSFYKDKKEQEQNINIHHITISSSQNEEKDVREALVNFQSLNLVLFVLKLEPIDEQLNEQFEKVITCLGPEASLITAVIITWFDSFDSRAEVKVVQELKARVERLHDFAKKGIHMITLPQLDYVEKSLHSFLSDKSERSKKTLQNLCIQAKEKVNYATGAQPDIDKPKKVLIFGKTGAGKSTVANAILGSNQIPIESHTTRVADRHSCKEYKSISGAVYKIGIIDTVGMSDSRSNKFEISRRMRCAIADIQSVNLILFVIKTGRITDQERDSFEDVISFLQISGNSSTSAITAIVVTDCDQIPEDDHEAMKLELEENAKNVTQFASKGIHLVGLPYLDRVPVEIKEDCEKLRKPSEKKLQTLVRESQLEIPIQEPDEITTRQTRRNGNSSCMLTIS